MRRSLPRIVWLFWLGCIFWPCGSVLATEDHSAPTTIRVLGPLSAPRAGSVEAGPVAPAFSTVPEINPASDGSWSGRGIQLIPGVVQRWEDVELSEGVLRLDAGAVYWVASVLGLDRFSDVSIRLEGISAATVFLDGRALPENNGSGLFTASLHRGEYSLLIRLRVDDGSSVRIRAATEREATVTWHGSGTRAPTSYQQARRLVAIDAVAVNTTGTRIARRLSRRHATGYDKESVIGIFDQKGRSVVSEVGGGNAKPLAFSPEDGSLLLQRTKEDLSDLLIFREDTGELRTVVRDEPELDAVVWHPSGSHLLLTSSRGVDESKVEDDVAHRRLGLRERVKDYRTGPHLHLLEVESGARRRLTIPGDWVLDDAVFSPDGGSVVYTRTVPRADYPWFATEIRTFDLGSGEDSLVTTFTGGWESRPKALRVSPNGGRLAFSGPPEEVLESRTGHNTLHSAVYVVDLGSGIIEKVSGDASCAFTLRGGDMLEWTRDGRRLVAAVTDRTSAGLATITESDRGWIVERIPDPDGDATRIAALSGDATAAALVASNPERPERLYLTNTQTGTAIVLDEPNAELLEMWRLARVHDVSFAGPGGDRIDAWWYEPAATADSEKIPLIVYYYGGGTPTMRRFAFDHQFLAANGYAVLVMTPRGALGAGLDFADSHVNDWGPRSSADVLAGIDMFLEHHPEIDDENIGIYGGSYGGFLTAYLLTVTDRFAAAVDMYGISNLASYWGDGAWGYTYGDVAGFGSFPWNAPEIYADRSPLFRADLIHTPLLLLHGTADVNVPTSESEQLYAALEVLNRPVELVLFPGEGHGISGVWSTRAEHRTMMLEWFDMHLKDEPGAWNHRWAD